MPPSDYRHALEVVAMSTPLWVRIKSFFTGEKKNEDTVEGHKVEGLK